MTGNKESRRTSRLGVRIAVIWTVRSLGEFEQTRLCYLNNKIFGTVNVIFVELRRKEDATRNTNFIDKLLSSRRAQCTLGYIAIRIFLRSNEKNSSLSAINDRETVILTVSGTYNVLN